MSTSYSLFGGRAKVCRSLAKTPADFFRRPLLLWLCYFIRLLVLDPKRAGAKGNLRPAAGTEVHQVALLAAVDLPNRKRAAGRPPARRPKGGHDPVNPVAVPRKAGKKGGGRLAVDRRAVNPVCPRRARIGQPARLPPAGRPAARKGSRLAGQAAATFVKGNGANRLAGRPFAAALEGGVGTLKKVGRPRRPARRITPAKQNGGQIFRPKLMRLLLAGLSYRPVARQRRKTALAAQTTARAATATPADGLNRRSFHSPFCFPADF